jgi:hypothetical protein
MINKLLRLIGPMLLFFYLSSPGQVKKECNFAQADRCKWGFTGFKNGFKSSVNITPSRFESWRRIIVYNKTLPELYAIAFAVGTLEFTPVQIIVDVRNPELLEAKYCYELNTPPDLVDMMYTIMHQQLERQYPDYTASIEERVIAGVKRSVVVLRDRERGILN